MEDGGASAQPGGPTGVAVLEALRQLGVLDETTRGLLSRTPLRSSGRSPVSARASCGRCSSFRPKGSEAHPPLYDMSDVASELEALYRTRSIAFRNALALVAGGYEEARDAVQEAFAIALREDAADQGTDLWPFPGTEPSVPRHRSCLRGSWQGALVRKCALPDKWSDGSETSALRFPAPECSLAAPPGHRNPRYRHPRGERVRHFRARFDGCLRRGRPRTPNEGRMTTLREDMSRFLARLALSPANVTGGPVRRTR